MAGLIRQTEKRRFSISHLTFFIRHRRLPYQSGRASTGVSERLGQARREPLQALTKHRMSVPPRGGSFKEICYGYWMGQILRRADGGGESAGLRREVGSQASGGASKRTGPGVFKAFASPN